MTILETVRYLEEQNAEMRHELEALRTRLTIVEMEAGEVKSLRRAAIWVVGVIIAGAIGFGFSVLTLVPHV